MAEELENGLDEQEQEEQQEERTFTQAEVDALISRRLAKERKGQPSAEELSAFRAWQKEQNGGKDEESATQSDLDSALADYEMARRENYLLRKGVDPEDVDYYVYRISKSMDGETDFEDAAKEFFKTHKTRNSVRMDTGARLNGGNGGKKSFNEQMNELIRNAKG